MANEVPIDNVAGGGGDQSVLGRISARAQTKQKRRLEQFKYRHAKDDRIDEKSTIATCKLKWVLGSKGHGTGNAPFCQALTHSVNMSAALDYLHTEEKKITQKRVKQSPGIRRLSK